MQRLLTLLAIAALAAPLHADEPPIKSLSDLLSRAEARLGGKMPVANKGPVDKPRGDKPADNKPVEEPPDEASSNASGLTAKSPLSSRRKWVYKTAERIIEEDLAEDDVEPLSKELIALDVPEVVALLAPVLFGHHDKVKRKLVSTVAKHYCPDVKEVSGDRIKAFTPEATKIRKWIAATAKKSRTAQRAMVDRHNRSKELIKELLTCDDEERAEEIVEEMGALGEEHQAIAAIDMLARRMSEMSGDQRGKNRFTVKEAKSVVKYFAGIDLDKRMEGTPQRSYLEVWVAELEKARGEVLEKIVKAKCTYNRYWVNKLYPKSMPK